MYAFKFTPLLIERYRIKHVDIETRSLPMSEYISSYRDEEFCAEACKRCPNYGKTWSCPPFDNDMMVYDGTIELIMVRLEMESPLPYERTVEFMADLKREITPALLEYESRIEGRAFSLAGKCVVCHAPCARTLALPCRHPDKVRPSLEAVGFDLVKTADKLFGNPLEWSRPGEGINHISLILGVVY